MTVLLAQSNGNTVQGKVVDEYGNPIPYTTVAILNSTIGTVTDDQGNFSLITHTDKDLQIVIRSLGYEEILQDISFNTSKNQDVNIQLKTSNTSINEVIISGKSQATILREQSYAVEVLEAKEFKNLAVNANDILNKIPGVNIRQSGGFGEDAVLSLNGLSGSQIRVFMDGIPMEYFGSSLSLNNFPANLIERIEVYKGVVPIHLSADALGGAVNITTNNSQKSFLDASYSYGSFNTHTASINTQYRQKKSGFTTRLKSFYNYSDNNYKVDIKLWDKATGNYDDFTTEVEHFHDAYESKMAWLEAGFTNTTFADAFMVGVMYSDNYNEVQQPKSALGDDERPFGEVLNTESNLIFTFNYSKNHFLTEKLSLNSYFVYVKNKEISRNISSYDYDWFGNKTLQEDGTGERDLRKTYLTLNSKNILGNFNAEYAFNEVSNLAFSYNINFLNLEGDDPYNGENNTRYSDPIAFNKQVLASSYTHSFFDNKFRNTAFAKYYKYTQNSTDANYFGDESTITSANYNHLGYGIATSYFLNNFQFKASYENALRFPDKEELYGDGADIDANPNLIPEEGNNYNLGVIYKNSIHSNSVMLSVNGFVRDSKNFIFSRREGNSLVYVNLEDVLTQGVDFSALYNYNNKIIFNIAGTYTNKVNNAEFVGGSKNSLYKERMPNDPYAYGNATFSYIKHALLKNDDSFSISLNENYVHEFNYRWESLGFSSKKYIVPSQLTTDIDFVYSLQNQKYNISFGIMNVFDANTYDNLYQQNPGRYYHFKIRYFIN